MIVGILQSSYLPWIGFFDMLDRSDVFVYHNDLQYDKSWRNRNRIRVPSETGWQWLSVPVKRDFGTSTLLVDVRISYERPWHKKHWALIREHYHNAPHFREFCEPYKNILLDQTWERLVDLNAAIVEVAVDQLGLNCNIVSSDSLHLGGAVKNERIVKICKAVGANIWLANSACRSYVVDEVYKRENIKVEYQDYIHPVYQQQYTPFISHLCFLDLLFACGPESLNIIRTSRKNIIE